MFLTRFNRRDSSPPEDYFYRSAEEALSHLALFNDDNSGLYSSIVASNEKTNTVLRMLVFSDDGVATLYQMNGFARLKPQYCTPDERRLIYMITNLNDRTMRCTIVCLNSNMSIPPSELVGLEMITPIIVEDIRVSREASGVFTDQYGIQYDATPDNKDHMVSRETGEVFCATTHNEAGIPVAIIPLWEYQGRERWGTNG